ncbi:hypothetical protein ABEB36_007852, partial [Hypothenemus hampei]
MPSVRHCSEVEAAQIVTLHNAGCRQEEIAQCFNRGPSTVSNILKRYQDIGNFVWRSGQGRKRSATEIDD